MKKPLLTTSSDLYMALSAHYGMYASITQPYLEDVLQRAIEISAIQNVLHCRAYVNIDSVTHNEGVIQIPEQNLQDAATIYLVDQAKWILFLQSNVNRNEVYAWDIPVFMSGHRPEYYLIRPFNKSLYQEGWYIDANVEGALGAYIRNHTNHLFKTSMNSKLAEPPKFQVTQRVNSRNVSDRLQSYLYKDLLTK
jgi:hypothetical protein